MNELYTNEWVAYEPVTIRSFKILSLVEISLRPSHIFPSYIIQNNNNDSY